LERRHATAVGVTLVRQREFGDCGIAAVALHAARSYDEVAALTAHVLPGRDVSRLGLLNTHVLVLALQLGAPLIPTRRVDLDVDEGILRVRFAPATGRPREGHFVAVKRGLILCPATGLAQDWRDYFATAGARPGTLLKATRVRRGR
jgi:hypothetical protein